MDSLVSPSGMVTSGSRWLPACEPQPRPVLPPLEPGQVYITRRGTAYHPGWCQVVQRTWEFNKPALQICAGRDVGGRRLCRSCEGDSRQP
ncbi:hypothetical protein [Arthrobacter sp. Helios]|uniref:hypothetical protein n=1 Tax=Arthrobacter sp. Helios TaxID=2828862 RepID=UPI00204F5CF1|nr:hypothetical protein [Arthrobacter sp. Helios]UPO77197.1 hypothetical protein ArtHe_00270 [Arthrobacter sp. Helios]